MIYDFICPRCHEFKTDGRPKFNDETEKEEWICLDCLDKKEVEYARAN